MSFSMFVFAATGAAVWALVGLAVLAFVVFAVIPAVFRWMCFVGYCAFADRAEKAALRSKSLTAALEKMERRP